MTKFSLPVQFIKPVFKADRSVRLEFETRELSGMEIGILADSRQTEGWLVFSPNDDIKEEDVPKEKADPMLGTKTQAQRLRNSLYRLWEQTGKQAEFEEYYRIRLEKIIDQVKEKLE